MTITLQQLRNAKAALTSAGWTRTHSVMHDGGGTGNYGTCYVKDGRKFYLNKDTFTNLPIDGE